MKTKGFMFGVLFILFVTAIAVPARAQSTVDECKTRIDLIQTDLDVIFASGGIGGNNIQRTYDSLTSKLQGAEAKLDQNKFADALRKLQDFRTAIIELRDAAKPKLSVEDANLLLDGNNSDANDEGVNGAIICVALLP
jgi:hypothetical protein